MLKPTLLILICLTFLGLSIRLFYNGLRQTGIDRTLGRLMQGQPQLEVAKSSWAGLERAFLRAG